MGGRVPATMRGSLPLSADTPSDLDSSPITLSAIREAARALADVAIRTPLHENPDVNERLGGRLLIKGEHAQRTGSFKIRGAFNRIRQMTVAERRCGAITYSSGNHAQGVALAARLFETSALIVMPSDTPQAKVDRTRSLGADVAFFDRDTEDYNDVVAGLKAETGRVTVPPSGDVRVLAGAGTAALELHDQAGEAGALLDAVLVPCGGGGLTAATAFLMRELTPDTAVYAVEPSAFDDTRRSLAAGKRVRNAKGARTVCDAIMTPIPNEQTFEINQSLLAGGLVASDAEVIAAMRFAFEHFKIVVEPGAAVGLAAVLNGGIDIAGRTVAIFTTGGNIDANRYADLMLMKTEPAKDPDGAAS